MTSLLITNANVVNEGQIQKLDVLVQDTKLKPPFSVISPFTGKMEGFGRMESRNQVISGFGSLRSKQIFLMTRSLTF